MSFLLMKKILICSNLNSLIIYYLLTATNIVVNGNNYEIVIYDDI